MSATTGGHFAPRDGARRQTDVSASSSSNDARKPYAWLDDDAPSSPSISDEPLLSLTNEGLDQLHQHPGYSAQFPRIHADDARLFDDVGAAQATQTVPAQSSASFVPTRRVPVTHKRKRTGTIVGLTVALICIVAIAAACYIWVIPRIMGYDFRAVDAADNEIDQEINASIYQLTKADETIVPMDNLVQASIDSSSVKDIDGVLAKKAEAASDLAEAQGHVDKAGSLPNPTDDQRKIIRNIQTSIKARQQMLDSGARILEADKAIAGSQSDLNESYKLMVQADESARKALEAGNQYAELRNQAAQEALQTGEVHAPTEELQAKADEAASHSKEALDTITKALNLVTEVHKRYPGPEILAIQDYLDERVKAMTLSSEADQLVAEGKLEEAQAKIDEYNQMDAHVTELSSKIADDPSKLLSAVYERLTKTDLTTYNSVRATAAESDAAIRAYQGIHVSPQGMRVEDAQQK